MTTAFTTASDFVGQRVNEVRKRRGWTAAQLAERCEQVAAMKISDQGVFNIENGRRKDGVRRRHVSVDELLGLALALDVAPVHLLVPLESNGTYPVTAERPVHTQLVRNWVRGSDPLPDMDQRVFYSEVPEQEFRVVPVSDLPGATTDTGGGS